MTLQEHGALQINGVDMAALGLLAPASRLAPANLLTLHLELREPTELRLEHAKDRLRQLFAGGDTEISLSGPESRHCGRLVSLTAMSWAPGVLAPPEAGQIVLILELTP